MPKNKITSFKMSEGQGLTSLSSAPGDQQPISARYVPSYDISGKKCKNRLPDGSWVVCSFKEAFSFEPSQGMSLASEDLQEQQHTSELAWTNPAEQPLDQDYLNQAVNVNVGGCLDWNGVYKKGTKNL